MTPKQQSKIQSLTNRLVKEGENGAITFSVSVFGDTAVFHATNTEAPEFYGLKSLVAVIGPRGGMKIRHSTGFICI